MPATAPITAPRDVSSALRKRRRPVTCAILLALGGTRIPSVDGAVLAEERHERILHVFDFDERADGNLEPLPKYWSPLRPPGFPHFAGGGFDFEVGHTAPPSFHLSTQGRNVAFTYLGPETPVRASSDYRVVAHVRFDQLIHARACLSAFYVDREGSPLMESLVRSAYLGGDAGNASWREVELILPAAPPEARTVGLAVWVLQESMWKMEPSAPRAVPRNDVRGGAWFDDIAVYRLPRVAIASSSPDNVLSTEGRPYIEPTLTDQDDTSLSGALSILNVDGRVIERYDVPMNYGGVVGPPRIPVDHLKPGLYTARLDVMARGDAIISRELIFARVAPRRSPAATIARAFGVSVDPVHRATPETELELLRKLQTRSVKIPVWTGRPDPDPTAAEFRAMDRLYQALTRDGFALTAVLAGAPNVIAMSRGASTPGIVDLLRNDPEPWRESLAAIATPYSGVFHWWQVGADGGEAPAAGDETAAAALQLRQALSPYILNPRIVLPASIDDVPPSSADGSCLQIPALASYDEITAALKAHDGATTESDSVHVSPLPADRFERRYRLGDLSWRMAVARHAGAHVYTPQPWRTRETPEGLIAEPDDTFTIVRTVADLIGEAGPGPRLDLGNGIEALAFHDRDRSVLIIRDAVASTSPRRVLLQLGVVKEAVDIDGCAVPLGKADDGRHMVELSGTPLFIPNVERWLVELLAAPRLSPSTVDPGRTSETFTIELPNHGGRPLAGTAKLSVPAGWNAYPSEFPLATMPGRTEHFTFTLEHGVGEPAGRKTIQFEIELPEFGYFLMVPLSLEVLLDDVNVRGLAWVEGDHVVVRHSVTNLAGESLSFRASALAPGRERQNRPMPGLQPGDTQTATYRFARSSELIGRTLRLVLAEANDGPRRHTLELVVP